MVPTIRPYVATFDRESVVEVVKAVFTEYGFTWDGEAYCSDLYDIEGRYLANGGSFWVASLGEKVVGCVGLRPHPGILGQRGTPVTIDGKVRVAGTQGELVRLYVHAEGRGHGLGVRLTQTVMEAAKGQGITHLELWSDKFFTHAHAVYLRLGATIIGERICDDPDEAPEWGMILPT